MQAFTGQVGTRGAFLKKNTQRCCMRTVYRDSSTSHFTYILLFRSLKSTFCSHSAIHTADNVKQHALLERLIFSSPVGSCLSTWRNPVRYQHCYREAPPLTLFLSKLDTVQAATGRQGDSRRSSMSCAKSFAEAAWLRSTTLCQD